MTPSLRAVRLLGGFAVAVAGVVAGFALFRPAPIAPAPADRPADAGRLAPSSAVPDDRRRALLVGVTRYDHLPDSNLDGPGNDVDLFGRVLVERFGFPPGNVVRLTEEESRADARPTRANIEREFRRLAEAVGEGDQVVVFLAGHGARQPEPVPSGPNPEPDGTDEVFLPADVRRWSEAERRAPGAVVDDEIGAWLRAIAAKKAFVWAVFDCCHSGSMTREAPAREGVRAVAPGVLVPEAALAAARRRAADRSPLRPTDERPRLAAVAADDYLVATYACRATEKTPEDRYPDAGPAAKVHGLFTYTLCEALTQAAAPLTYQDLIQQVQVRYARRPQGAPTPTAAGGRDREVLGRKRWPGRSDILLRTGDGRYAVTAGALHGLTPGTVLVAHGPAGTPAAADRLGYVRVTAVNPTGGTVEPVEFDGRPAPSGLPDNGWCKVVATDYGVARFRLAVALPLGPERDWVVAAVRDMAAQPSGPVELIEDARRSDWVIDARDGRLTLAEVSGGGPTFPLPADDRFRGGLAEAMDQLFRARNLLAVASRVQTGAGGQGADLRLSVELLRHKSKSDTGEVVRPTADGLMMREGELVSFRVRNLGRERIDVTLLCVDSAATIRHYIPDARAVGYKNTILPGEAIPTPVSEPLVGPFGPEYVVALAVPAARDGESPFDFSCLDQPGLALRGGDRPRSLDTPRSAARISDGPDRNPWRQRPPTSPRSCRGRSGRLADGARRPLTGCPAHLEVVRVRMA